MTSAEWAALRLFLIGRAADLGIAPDAAEDLVHTALLELLEALAAGTIIETPEGYCVRRLQYRRLDAARRDSTRRRLEERVREVIYDAA